MKYKLVEEKNMFYVMFKKCFFCRWKYVRDINNPSFISTWSSRRVAQSYINFKANKK